MKTVKLTLKASQDLEKILQQVSKVQTDTNFYHLSNLYHAIINNDILSPHPKLGGFISTLPFGGYVIYYICSGEEFIILRILIENQDIL